MPQIIIDSSNKVSNYHALEAVSRFIKLNCTMRRSQGYLHTRKMTIDGEVRVKVKEMPHKNKDESPCSVVFMVTRCE